VPLLSIARVVSGEIPVEFPDPVDDLRVGLQVVALTSLSGELPRAPTLQPSEQLRLVTSQLETDQ